MLPPSNSTGPYDLPPYREDSPPSTAPLPPAHVLLHVSVLSGVPKAKPFMDCPPPTTLFTHRRRLRSTLTVYRRHPTRQTGSSALLKNTPYSFLPQNVRSC